MRNIILSFSVFILFLLLNSSCKKFVSADVPPSLVESAIVFRDDQTAETALLGLYSQMNQLHLSITNGGLTLYTGLSSDEIYTTSGTTAAAAFWNNALLADNSTVNFNFWTTAYKLIYQANSILEGVEKSATLSTTIRKRLSGEAFFLRAFVYFNMVNLFGEVPLVTTTDYRANAVLPRTPIAIVYDQIEADLITAKELFDGLAEPASKGRVGKWAIASLLARVYLYLGEWSNAELYSTSIINAGSHSLVNNLNTIFPGSSTEVIWQLLRDNVNTADGAAFIPSSSTARPAYAITEQLYNSFEAGDLRKTAWISSNLVSGIRYYYVYKYKVRSNSVVTEYNCILRLAEQYLIRAEARAHQNNIAGANADLNLIRKRAGLLDVSIATSGELLIHIEQERRAELFAEWGHRWFDLKRWGRVSDVLSVAKGVNWSATDALYPIPQQSLESNPFLVQNPGY
jgi:hypothetical protein